MRGSLALVVGAWALVASAAVSERVTLWKGGENGIRVYRIPALETAPNGDLVAVCDARRDHGGDLYSGQSINIAVRRSKDGGKTWTPSVNAYTWPYGEKDKWSASDPSLIVDRAARKIFLLCNVWHVSAGDGVFHFYVQESRDNGRTWGKPRDLSRDLAFPGWGFGKSYRAGGFIFISSGSGTQLADGTLLHTLVHVGDGNALFGSPDHGKTWRPYGTSVKSGDECKVVELPDGRLLVNSRWRGGGRAIHVTRDRGRTWTSRYDAALTDAECNAQLLRAGELLLFSNCASTKRENLRVRASADGGETWSRGVSVCPGGAGYSDLALLKDGRRVGCLYEGANYATVDFVTIPLEDLAREVRQPRR